MNQKGAIPILLLVAAIGVVSVITIASIAPFRDGLLGSLFPKQSSFAAGPNDWAQVAKDPQRTGYSAETLGTTFAIKCRYAFQPERVSPVTQAIVYGGTVFIGTQQGNLYAIDSVTCAKKWSYKTNGPILNSAAADNGIVYVGSMDGTVYALNVSSGTEAWKKSLSINLGFSAAPLLADGKVIIGGRDGKLYGLNPTNGTKLWEYNANSPILMTPAWNNGKAYFGSMDMFVHAVNTTTGAGAWKSARIPGAAFKDYWPVVTQGKVIVRPLPRVVSLSGIRPGRPLGPWTHTGVVPGTTLTSYQWLTVNGPTIVAGNAASIPEFMTAQDVVMTSPNTSKQGVFVLDETDGVERVLIPHYDTQSLTGTITPPCVDKDGLLVMPVEFILSGWGRVNLTTKRYVDLLYDGLAWNGQPFSQTNTPPKGFGNGDENLNVTCTTNLILGFHHEEGNANFTGFFNLLNRTWTVVPPGIKNQQMSSNNQGPSNPVSVSNGYVYHIVVNELIVRSTN